MLNGSFNTDMDDTKKQSCALWAVSEDNNMIYYARIVNNKELPTTKDQHNRRLYKIDNSYYSEKSDYLNPNYQLKPNVRLRIKIF